MSEYSRLGAQTRVLACSLVVGGSMFFQIMPVFAEPGELLQLTQTIALPDVRGRIDHLDIDLDGSRLFVAASGNNSVEVIDLRAGRRSARLEHLREPQGVAYVPEVRRLFVASGESGRVDVFAGNSLAAVGRVDALEDADNVRYDPVNERVYVGYGSALAVLEAPTMQLVSRIKLRGHPESFQLESTGSRIFINVPKAEQIAVVDRKLGNVVGSWVEILLKEKGMTIFARVDHAAGAAKVGKKLRPTEVLIFGNPRAGTPLMQERQTIGLDLPLRVLVWEDENGQTWLTYRRPALLAKRHGIDRPEAVKALDDGLAALAHAVTSE